MIAMLLLTLLSYHDVLQADLITQGKIRWSKMDAGERVTVEIEGGNARRMNPGWSPAPQPLAYDLGRERALARAIKAAKLPAVNTASDKEDWRTLEVLLNDSHSGWRSAGTWSMPLKSWQKGRYGAISAALEPLFDVKPELYGTLGANQKP